MFGNKIYHAAEHLGSKMCVSIIYEHVKTRSYNRNGFQSLIIGNFTSDHHNGAVLLRIAIYLTRYCVHLLEVRVCN